MKAVNMKEFYTTQIPGYGILVDTTPDKGGSGLHARPHDLLETALASCMNIALKMEAKRLGLPDLEIETTVTLDRSRPDETVFEYGYVIKGGIDERTRVVFDEALERCPVKKTLSKKIVFKRNRG